jgi:hypothetical protein
MIWMIVAKTTEPGYVPGSPKLFGTKSSLIIFGGPAVLTPRGGMADPWLCVTGFHRFCFYRFFSLLTL